jgi:LacI family transcriptional regulator
MLSRSIFAMRESMTSKEEHFSPQLSITSLDVARKAGVSRAAVSYVLNGTRPEHVSVQTRMKILQAAEELGYHIHPSARALRSGQSDEICCVFHSPQTMMSHEVDSIIQQQIFQHGYVPVFYTGPGVLNEKWCMTLKQMFARRPRGLIMSQFLPGVEDLDLARQMGVEHMVLLSPRPVENVPAIIFSNQAAGALAIEHLLERGHRRLVFIQPDNPLLDELFQGRLEGARAVLAHVPDATLEVCSLAISLSGAHALVAGWLERQDRPTGIYTFNDEHALCLLAALIDFGVKIPQEMAVVGTDNLSASEFLRPSLTTIGFGNEKRLGQLAVEMLICQLSQPPSSSAVQSLTLTPHLIPRSSS